MRASGMEGFIECEHRQHGSSKTSIHISTMGQQTDDVPCGMLPQPFLFKIRHQLQPF